MLEIATFHRRGIAIASSLDVSSRPAPRPGLEVAAELNGRYLLWYLRSDDVGRYIDGTARLIYVTPTIYSPEEAPIWLNLPAPDKPRTHVLLLDPEKIDEIIGPMYVGFTTGIEYILPNGFPRAAIIVLGAGPDAAWEHVVS